jgi:hypothetical protein
MRSKIAAACLTALMVPLAHSTTQAEMAEIVLSSQSVTALMLYEVLQPSGAAEFQFETEWSASHDAFSHHLLGSSLTAAELSQVTLSAVLDASTGGYGSTETFSASGGALAHGSSHIYPSANPPENPPTAGGLLEDVDLTAEYEVPPGSGVKYKILKHTRAVYGENGKVLSTTTLTLIRPVPGGLPGETFRRVLEGKDELVKVDEKTLRYVETYDLGDDKVLKIQGITPPLSGGKGSFSVSVSQVPEPGVMSLVMAGFGVLLLVRRRP